MDPVTMKRIELMHPKIREEVYKLYEETCYALSPNVICRLTHTLRTDKEQNELYAQGRTTPGKKVTNAKGGQSYHNYGLAFDICLIINGKTASWDTVKDFDGDKVSDWHEVVTIVKKYGWEWGGDWKQFKDAPHFQKTFGKTTAELKKLRGTNLYPEI